MFSNAAKRTTTNFLMQKIDRIFGWNQLECNEAMQFVIETASLCSHRLHLTSIQFCSNWLMSLVWNKLMFFFFFFRCCCRVYRLRAHSWVFTPKQIKRSRIKLLPCQQFSKHRSDQMSSMRSTNWCAEITVKLTLLARKLVSSSTVAIVACSTAWIRINGTHFSFSFRTSNFCRIMGNWSCCCTYSVRKISTVLQSFHF